MRGKAAYFLRKSAKLKRERKSPKEFEATYDLFENEINALDVKSDRNEDEVRLGNRRDEIMEEVKDNRQDRPRVRIIYPDGKEIKYVNNNHHYLM